MAFMDKEDFTQLATTQISIFAKVQPQHNEQEIAELEEFSIDMAAAMATVTVGILILQGFLYLGLKYLWNLMNLL